ncbi:hypothetical protein [Vibrio mediterranei]|uniref:hypothetical protein n=1 Tax=Vibrio mediterranei TaxID=689 RepID=UPI00148C993E|nr:hypothetical protein [Vibrio mediterranei]
MSENTEKKNHLMTDSEYKKLKVITGFESRKHDKNAQKWFGLLVDSLVSAKALRNRD